MRTLSWIVGGIVWGLITFLVAFHVHFPSDAALERARYEVERVSDGKWAIDAESLNLWRVSGASANELVLYSVNKKARRRKVRRRASGSDDVDGAVTENPALKASPFLRFDEVRARVALVPMILGKRQVNFDAELLGGNLEGSFATADTRRELELDAAELDLSLLPIGGDDWNVDATGSMRIDADVALDFESVRESTGELHLAIDQFAIRSAKVMGLDLTPVSFTEAALDINVANGKAEIAKGVLDGDLLDATFSGNVSMSKRETSRWRLRIDIKLELDESLDQFARFAPQLKDARDDDGVYHLSCMGTIGRPTCNPDKYSAGTIKGGGGVRDVAAKIRKDKMDNPDSDFVRPSDEQRDADREDRRLQRLERIRNRRELLRQERKAEDQGIDLDDAMDGEPEFMDERRPRPMDLPDDFQPNFRDVDRDFEVPLGPDGEQFQPEDMMHIDGPLDGGFQGQEMDELPEPY